MTKKKYKPTRVTLSINQISTLKVFLAAGYTLKQIGFNMKKSYYVLWHNMKLLGLQKPNKIKENQMVAIQVCVCRKHYKVAYKDLNNYAKKYKK